MPQLFQKPEFQLFALGTVGFLVLLVAFFVTLAKFYRRCGADEALVRTGAGGNKVVIGGGITVYPILHQLLRVSLHSIKLSVERSGKNALVTKDKIKANVTTELYIKVEPIAEDVLAAARSFGERNFDEQAIGDLIEGKLTDALRSVSANQTFMELHGQRKQFAEHIQSTLSDELKKNGLTLENVSITALAMVPVKELDPQDVFDAEGLRAITDSVQSNAEQTTKIQREKELAIQLTNAEAKKRALTIEQDQKQAEADQARRVSEYAATQKAETAKAVYVQEQAQELAALEKRKATETARIQQEQAIAVAEAARQRGQREAQIAAEKAQQAAEIAKQREIEASMIEKEKVVQAAEVDRQKALETASIDKQKAVESAEIVKQQAVETARIAKQIAVTQSEEQAARAAALKAQAEAEQQQAMQGIITVEETAKANREKAIAVIKSEEDAQRSRIAAEREAFKLKLEAETQAATLKAHAEGEAAAKRAAAEGEIARAQGLAQSRELDAQANANVMRKGAEADADRVRISAEAKAQAASQEAQALIALAEATRKRGEAEAEAKRRLVEAENAVATKFLLRDVAVKALDVLPAVTRELMTPARAISEIKVLQLQGTGGSAAANGEGAPSAPFGNVASPVLKTILEAGAAYPLLREMLAFSQVDERGLADKARSFLATLPSELRAVIDKDPELAKKLDDLGVGRAVPSGAGIQVHEIDPPTIPPAPPLPGE
ncbi:flotillin domain-containing protein [Polyangium sp. 6x1]|uniref:flotillin domain-containing protein n=1 Tax=Polyangium sp. 6x1 TaxID=3042689 RepID=UPI0024828A14|nr:flotillin domain-containing protein [Polyangium sp. 6x1]MDI1442998.1 flotillin domain-containing protein [Polyangium sp. 6x1]